jgi:hypothetical protein
MATLVIGGRSFEIAPYKLGALRKAAPHIDAINASVQELEGDDAEAAAPTITGLFENTEHIVAILAIGLQKLDPALDAAALDDMIGPEDMPALGIALRDILAESGLAPKGEAQAPAQPTEVAGASTSN